MLFWPFCVVKVDLGEKMVEFVTNMLGGGTLNTFDFCCGPSDLHNSENVYAPVRCNQTQAKNYVDIFQNFIKESKVFAHSFN